MSDEGFLARWSRRKRAVEAGRAIEEPAPAPGAPAPLPAAAPSPEAAPIGGAPPPPPEAEPEFDPATLPPLDSLTAGSDFSAFLRKEVPEALKRAALRKAWALDPAIRDFVGPADYAWDFNAPDGITGFALELGEDAERLLAQAVGLDRHGAPSPQAAPEAAAGAGGRAAPRAGWRPARTGPAPDR